MTSIRKSYSTIQKDFFPEVITIDMDGQKLEFTKKTWTIPNENGIPEKKGLRYGDNPDQSAALYTWTKGSFQTENYLLEPDKPLITSLSEENFIQFGKHPGKTNLTDLNTGISILTKLTHTNSVVILKHNNPCGVAVSDTISDAYEKAYMSDRIAAMGGCVVLNKPMDLLTAEKISKSYSEVVAAPYYEEGTTEILKKRKNLRIIQMKILGELHTLKTIPHINFSTLGDGGILLELSQISRIQSSDDLIPAFHKYKGKEYKINRTPSKPEFDDLLMAWNIAASVTSNSIVMVKNGVTTAIGTGEQDRVGAVKLAIKKAFTKYSDILSFKKYGISIFQLEREVFEMKRPKEDLNAIEKETKDNFAGLKGSAIASDGFFPFRDGVDAALEYGITSFIQPGGSIRDFESIEACNEKNATMVFTNQRVFRH